MAAHRGHGAITTKDCLVGKKSLDFYEELCLFLNVTKGIDYKRIQCKQQDGSQSLRKKCIIKKYNENTEESCP